MSAFRLQLKREWIIHRRHPKHLLYASVFFLMLLVFFPLTISPEPLLLRKIAPGIIWVAVFFAFFLSSLQLFQYEDEEGLIEQWCVSKISLGLFVLAKMTIHWLFMLLPILLLSPIIGLFFHFTAFEVLVLCLSVVCGSLCILLLCATASAASIGLKREGILMGLIVFPLTIPVLILGSSTLSESLAHLPTLSHLALLLACSLLCLGLLPVVMSAMIRINLVE